MQFQIQFKNQLFQGQLKIYNSRRSHATKSTSRKHTTPLQQMKLSFC